MISKFSAKETDFSHVSLFFHCLHFTILPQYPHLSVRQLKVADCSDSLLETANTHYKIS